MVCCPEITQEARAKWSNMYKAFKMHLQEWDYVGGGENINRVSAAEGTAGSYLAVIKTYK